MTAVKKIVILTDQKRRERGSPQRACGEAPGLVKRLMERVQEPLLWFPRRRMNEAGPAGLGLISLNNFSGLWGMETASCCLVPAPRVIGEGEVWLRV